MGVRVAVVICATSFLLGCFFTHWIADSITLWRSPLTDTQLYAASAYYSILSTMPRWMDFVIVIVGTSSALALMLSFWDGRAGNLMFDGASAFLSSCALGVWVYSVLPNIDMLAERIPISGAFPLELKKSTLEIATKNLVCSVALTGVILLQAGRETSEQKSSDHEQDDEPEEGGEILEGEATGADTETAVDDEVTALPEVEHLDVPRGRRRSHHDHLEADLDNVSETSSSPSLRSSSPKKRDSLRRKRKSLVAGNRKSVSSFS